MGLDFCLHFRKKRSKMYMMLFCRQYSYNLTYNGIFSGGIALNTELESFKRKITGKKVAVLGIGISNTPLIKFLSDMGADITAFDRSEKSKLEENISKLACLDIKYCLGEDYLKNLKGFDIIFKTPAVRPDIPELVREKERGAVVTSEMEVFFELCPAEIFAVTGSDGKTTTTTLIYRMLVEEGFKCWLGGNIGMPLLSRIVEIEPSHKVVLELSSFQLHTMKRSPSTAIITNVSPNHLDIHKSMDEYTEAKKNIFRYQNRKDRLILNLDNEITSGFASEAAGRVVYFSRKSYPEEGAFLREGHIVYRKDGNETEIVKADKILLPGMHNLENFLAATAAVAEHVKPEAVRKVAESFKGVEHRIEPVREINGVWFFNDSIASSPNRTIAGLNSFNKRVILIAGGKDKNNNYKPLGEQMVEKVKCLVLLGQTAPQIEKSLRDAVIKTGRGGDIPVINCSSMEEAVKAAFKHAVKDDIIILSPASTSFDMFKNFEERGRVFKKIVNSL
jgi:UDP-N-acetylmuramoylalanine--D-glutamate ligase